MGENIFKIRTYNHAIYKEFNTHTCVICSREFQAPKRFGNRISTCSSYCQSVALSLKKMKGAYTLCYVCDKAVWKMPTSLKAHKRHYCSKKCTDLGWSIYYEQDFGEKKINTGRKKYYGANWLTQRKKARKRDNYTCQRCKITEKEYSQELSVHHIVPFVYFETYKEANNLKNLLNVCEPCHRKIHSGENNHYKFDPNKIIFKNELNSVLTKQKEKAEEVVDLLFNSELSLTEISKVSGMSYTGVTRIYKGFRWKELYDNPACVENPRSVGNGKVKKNY